MLAGRSNASDQGFIPSVDGDKATYIALRADLYETVAAESCSLCIVLRHRAPSSLIYPSEVIYKLLALSRVFLLFSGGKSIVLVKKKHLPVVVFFYLCT